MKPTARKKWNGVTLHEWLLKKIPDYDKVQMMPPELMKELTEEWRKDTNA